MKESQDQPEFRIEPLASQHDRAAFSCEDAPLEKYLWTQARQDSDRKLAVVFILTPDGRTIAGYYCLSQYAVQAARLPKEIIGRLARSTAFKGQGLGEFLLMDALNKCLVNSRRVASWAVVVDAKNEKAILFYKRYGFIELPEVPHRLFLPMATIEQMFA